MRYINIKHFHFFPSKVVTSCPITYKRQDDVGKTKQTDEALVLPNFQIISNILNIKELLHCVTANSTLKGIVHTILDNFV